MNLSQQIEQLLTHSRKHLGDTAVEQVATAVRMAERFHETQMRKSDGAPYVTHCLHVAESCLLSGLNDTTAICAALLHDAIEDAPAEMEPARKIAELDKQALPLVEALSKISDHDTNESNLAATYQRILRAAAIDIRCLLIKIFDVLHNTKTLHVHDKSRAKEKARLGLIYVGVARRLGMMEIADALIEQILPYLMPKKYRRAIGTLNCLQAGCDKQIQQLPKLLQPILEERVILNYRLEAMGIADYFHLASKPGSGNIQPIGWPVFRLELMVDEALDAWRTLGEIHHRFGPMPRHLRDYLNAPRINGFRALTTRVFWESHPLSVHIFRERDDLVNRKGILAQWGTKGGTDQKRYRKLLATLGDSDVRIHEVYAHVLPDTLDVYTPDGDRLTFPVDSVVLDFAYLVHTDLGKRCAGALINGVRHGPEYVLTDGDVVKILKDKRVRPQRTWLNLVKTARARTLIKRALRSDVIPVPGVKRDKKGAFQITHLTGPDIVWSTCCLPVPDDVIVGRLTQNDQWIVHCALCEQALETGWHSGGWNLETDSEILNITFQIDHKTGSLLSVLELLAKHHINGHALHGKVRSKKNYLIDLDMGGKDPRTLGKVLKQLIHVPSVQEIRKFLWKN